MKRLLHGWVVAALLSVTPALAFDRDDLNRVLGAVFDNGNPMNEQDVECQRCDLRGADLSDFDMRRADLFGADLTDATLAGSDLTDGIMRSADLTNADLSNANLTGVDLTDAIIEGAALTDAIFCRTIMPDGTDRNDGCEG